MFMNFEPSDSVDLTRMVLREREHSLSDREWMHRLAAYGITVKDTENGPKIARLSDGEEICGLPPL